MKRLLLLSLFFFSLFSCEEVFECILGLEPQINETSIEQATIDEPYFDVITAEVKNDAFDDGYDYFFEVVGNLPEGIELIYFYRRIELVGTPVESGRFNFTVYLYVESFDDGFVDPSPTCNDEVSKTFTLLVNEQ
ncbi:MAG: hypothetical protein AAGH46_05235 [Bacteroidota bacterium]